MSQELASVAASPGTEVGEVPSKRTEQVSLRLAPKLLERVDVYAARLDKANKLPDGTITRTAAIVSLLEKALEAEGVPEDPDSD